MKPPRKRGSRAFVIFVGSRGWFPFLECLTGNQRKKSKVKNLLTVVNYQPADSSLVVLNSFSFFPLVFANGWSSSLIYAFHRGGSNHFHQIHYQRWVTVSDPRWLRDRCAAEPRATWRTPRLTARSSQLPPSNGPPQRIGRCSGSSYHWKMVRLNHSLSRQVMGSYGMIHDI